MTSDPLANYLQGDVDDRAVSNYIVCMSTHRVSWRVDPFVLSTAEETFVIEYLHLPPDDYN